PGTGPAIFAGCQAYAIVHVVGLSGGQRAPPGAHRGFDIIGVQSFKPALPEGIRLSDAGFPSPAGGHAEDVSMSVGCPRYLRILLNRVAVVLLTLPQSLEDPGSFDGKSCKAANSSKLPHFRRRRRAIFTEVETECSDYLAARCENRLRPAGAKPEREHPPSPFDP